MQADVLRLGLGLGLGLEEAMQADLLHLLWSCLLYLVWLCLLCLLWRYTHTVAAAVQADLAECTRKQKEAAERASEFEKQWVAESKLRKDLHNQLQVRTLSPALTPTLSLTPTLTLTLTLP